jgi:preprotein translocase subunit SecE
LTTTDEVNGGTMATETRGEAAAKDEGKGRPARKRTGPALFVRQVIAELRKVIWPTRRELITYTTVSLVFVLIMVAIVSGLDWALQKGVFWAFG